MGLIDFLLNLACLLLWIGFRASWFPTGRRPDSESGVTLRSTLRRADSTEQRRWSWLIALVGVLLARAFLYLQLGPAVQWTPQLRLGVIVLNLRVDTLAASVMCSVLGFALFWIVFHFWLALFSGANASLPAHDPVQRLVRLHLGLFDRMPALLKLASALGALGFAWWLANDTLVKAGAVPAALSNSQVWLQGLVLGVGAMCSWKWPVTAVLLAHVAGSYVHFGEAQTLKWVDATAKNLLGPLHRLPLQAGRVDFAPVAGIALVWIAAHYGEQWLTGLFQRLVA